MSELLPIYVPTSFPPAAAIDSVCWEIRRANFSDQITFHAPGLKLCKTSEYNGHNVQEFVSISVTGTACALSCEHSKMSVLKGMTALPQNATTSQPCRTSFSVCISAACWVNGARWR